MMKKLVGNMVSVLMEAFMWLTFGGCAIVGLFFGYNGSGMIGAVGGLVLGAIAGMLLNTLWWLLSTLQEIRNYSKKWLGKAEPLSPTPMQVPDFRRLLVDNGRKIIIALVSLALLSALLVGIPKMAGILIAKNLDSSAAREATSESTRKAEEAVRKAEEAAAKQMARAEAAREANSAIPGMYPQGSERLLTASDLQNISKKDLRIMRNEIFARHGYIFKSDDLKEHFKNLDWYIPKYEDVYSMLTNIEKKNVEFIKRHE